MGWWARKPVNHTSWVALVTPTDRPKSVRNRCLIELFCGVVCVVTLPFWHFCWCRGFCHRTESDLFLFLLEAGDNQSLKIQLARLGIEPRSSCSASQKLNHSASAAPYTMKLSMLYFISINDIHYFSIKTLEYEAQRMFPWVMRKSRRSDSVLWQTPYTNRKLKIENV